MTTARRIAEGAGRLARVSLFAVAVAVCGCGSDARSGSGADADSDADSDADADADSDADADADTDTSSALLPDLDGTAGAALSGASHLVAVVTPAWGDPAAQLALFARAGGEWALALGPWPAEVGYNGLSWGRGLTQPPTAATNVKAEGDGTAPAGIFRLGTVMGYGAQPPDGLALPYSQSTAQTICVDDPASSHYNKIIDASQVASDWSSYEDMLRGDDLYSLLAPVDHNGLIEGETPVPGGGSCIFVHLWSGAGSSTVGCTALDGAELTELLLALDALDDTILVQLPRAEYDAAVAQWELPPLPE
jgi:L,D-peptidoglycan transpeptidase YkuD (ErfK/YbiS/YcfS/YnhG family)